MATVAVATGLAGWLWATIAANHPTRSAFERLRRTWDPLSLWLPSWRFFAPDPGGYEFVLLCRVRTAEGDVSPWSFVDVPPERTWSDMVLSPRRRELKSLSCVVYMLQAQIGRLPRDAVPTTVPYRLLAAHAARHVADEWGPDAVRSYQFAVVRHAGYDVETKPRTVLRSSFTAV